MEKAKIKAKWKAQKKKEGLAVSSKLDLSVYHEEEKDSDTEGSDPNDTRLAVLPTEIPGEQPRSHLHPSRAHIHPELVKHSKVRTLDVPPTKKQKVLKEDYQELPSLRELKREAYSESTLHTFKSDPLKRRNQSKRGGRDNGFIERKGGRGQPNMKLRMNVMLEKIKRDFA